MFFNIRFFSITLLTIPFLSGCQFGYLAENGYYQAKLLANRQPLEKALKSKKLTTKEKNKLELANKARIFAETELKLKRTKNYTSFVKLDSPYVVHSLTVAAKNELKPFTWSFPFFGKFPYLGYFNKDSAIKAQKYYKNSNYDTSLRGVRAFSTLGWFNDPILSSMLDYSDYHVVNVIIHETVHATVYIKDAVSFNERLATFIGDLGTEIYYRKYEGENSKTLQKTKDDKANGLIFSKFISKELKTLKKWYKENKTFTEDERQQQFQLIKKHFKTEAQPLMKNNGYSWFLKAKINNAKLIGLKTYYKDLSDFEKLYKKLDNSFSKMIDFCKKLEKEDSPEKALKKFIN